MVIQVVTELQGHAANMQPPVALSGAPHNSFLVPSLATDASPAGAIFPAPTG